MTAENVLITGTTSGLGQALLEHYAGRGATVIAVNRRHVPELEARHPAVRFEVVDVRAETDVRKLIRALAETGQLPDRFLLNAGINRADNDVAFRPSVHKETFDTNLYGVLNFVGAVTDLPVGPTPRHLVAMGSMAAIAGNPYCLGYHSSKLALSSCFDVLSRMYAGTDLVFQQVVLGPVDTSIYTMAESFPKWVIQLRRAVSATPQDTAQAIARFARTRKKKLVFPHRALPLFVGMRVGQALVPGFYQGRSTSQGTPRRRAEPRIVAWWRRG